MDVAAIRHENLRLLIQEIRQRNPRWLQKDIASALGMSASYLSQLVGGKKMGDDVARKIEAERHLAHGWMDRLQATPRGVGESDAPPYLSRPLRIDPETIAAALRLIRLSFLNMGLEIDQEENGYPLAIAYDFLTERNEKGVTADNLLEFKPRLEHLKGGRNAAREAQDGDRRTRTGTG